MKSLFKHFSTRQDGAPTAGPHTGRQPRRSDLAPPPSFSSYSSLRRPGTGDQPLARRRVDADAASGQPASRLFSYHAKRSQRELNIGREPMADLPAQRQSASRLRRLRRHAGWLFGMVFVAGVVLYNLQLSAQPKVSSLVSASDAPFLRDTTEYQKAAAELLGQSIFNRNKLTINTTAVAGEMQRRFPELQSVTVTVPLIGGQSMVYVRPSDPALVLATGQGSYVIDGQGRALAEVGSQSQLDRLGVPTVTDQSNLRFDLGDRVLTRKTATFIATVARQLKAGNSQVQAMVLVAGGSQLDVYPAGRPYFVKYDTHDGAEESARLQTGNYLAVRRHLEARRVIPGQYIDVRLPGRAYYK